MVILNGWLLYDHIELRNGLEIRLSNCEVMKPFGPFKTGDKIWEINVYLEDGMMFCYYYSSQCYVGKLKMEIE